MVGKKVSKLLSETEQAEITAALVEAESKTSGEIVPVLASKSGRYDRGEDIVGVLVALSALTISWIFCQAVEVVSGIWGAGPELSLKLWMVLLIVVVGFVIGSAVAVLFPVLALPFTLKKEIEEEVERRAAECFYRFGIGKTKGATGILIYISLFEHRVLVKGDSEISKVLNQEDWNEVCKLIIAGIKNNDLAKGLKDGILKCGELLSSHFPGEAEDENELADQIHFLDL